MKHLAFDLGASSGKLFCGNLQGNRIHLEEIHRFPNAPVHLSRSHYWNFLDIYENLMKGIRKAVSKNKDIQTIGIDSFSNDFTFVSKFGELMTPIRSYRDERTIRNKEKIGELIADQELYRLTGNQISLFSTFMQLASMKLEHGLCSTDKGQTLLWIPDLLAFLLTGVRQTEYTMASVSQLFSYEHRGWSPELLNLLGLPKSVMPDIVFPGDVSVPFQQQIRSDFGIDGISFVPVCSHDTASAFLTCPFSEPTAILSSGTWALLGCETTEPIINETGYELNIANEGGFGKGHHRLLCNVMGTWLLQQLLLSLRAQGLCVGYGDLSELARDVADSDWLFDVDHRDFFFPGDLEEKIHRHGKGTRKPVTPGQIARCIYESLALKYRYVIEKIETLSSLELPRIVILGGGAQDTLHCQLTADACQRPVFTGSLNASATGNIIVQMISSGVIADTKQARTLLSKDPGIREFTPRMERRWEEKYRWFIANLIAT